MKKLIEKLRKWLIKKLGGHVEPICLPPPRYINLNVQTIQQETIVRTGNAIAIEEIDLVRARDKLYRGLFEGLVLSGNIRLQRTDMNDGSIRLRASLVILPEIERVRMNG